MSAVPAWKRLGLKLKGSAGDSPAAAPSTTTSTPSATRQPVPATSALKRKLPSQQQSFNNQNNYPTQNKRFRSDNAPAAQRKSVSFSQETKTTSTTDAAAKEKKREKKKAKKAKQVSKRSAEQSKKSKSDTNLEPSLAYLRQWHSARDQWKFNKNHQTLLIKYVFESDKIPSADVPLFYQYIRDLKGFVRTRLREQAQEIKKKDMEAGASAFPGGDKAKEKNEERQKQYEDAIARFLEDQKERTQEKSKKRSFDEVEFVLRIAPGGSGSGKKEKKEKKKEKKETNDKEDRVDKDVKERLIKRIRAEMVLEELADSEDATSTTATTTTTTTTTSTSASTSTAAAAAAPAPQPQTARASTDGQQPAKRRRLRNKRTDISDSESSDSSDSDSSDSESDSDEEMADAGAKTATTSTSSSSSSSSSSSEAESSESENEKSDSSESSDSDSD